MLIPVNTWLHIRPLFDVEVMFDDEDDNYGRVEVLLDSVDAGQVVGIDIKKGMVLVVEPSLIMSVGDDFFIKATETSIYAVEYKDIK